MVISYVMGCYMWVICAINMVIVLNGDYMWLNNGAPNGSRVIKCKIVFISGHTFVGCFSKLFLCGITFVGNFLKWF